MVAKIEYSQFFDREKVIKAIDRKKRIVLARQGRFYQQVVRRSMRSGGKRQKISAPGQPPRYHTGLLRQSIAFGYDARRDTVVIGAGPIGRHQNAANILEYGGRAKIYFAYSQGRDRKGRFKRKKLRYYRDGVYRIIKPRPFVGPKSINFPKGVDNFQKLTKTIPLR